MHLRSHCHDDRRHLIVSMDHSEGWEAIAEEFMANRSMVGAELVRLWAKEHLAPTASVVDVGCGSGHIAEVLVDGGFDVSGIDASPTMIAEFARRFPNAKTACEPAQTSTFFDRTFNAAISIGLLFLLSEPDQIEVLRRTANALKPGGRFLFTAPRHMCEWIDTLTGRPSRSLGAERYEQLLHENGLRLVGTDTDEGENHYYDAAAHFVR